MRLRTAASSAEATKNAGNILVLITLSGVLKDPVNYAMTVGPINQNHSSTNL